MNMFFQTGKDILELLQNLQKQDGAMETGMLIETFL